MSIQAGSSVCFNCNRTDEVIPLLVWQFRQRPLTVCSECTPLLIHKWAQVGGQLAEPKPDDSGE